jgi:hypothetical protein
MSKKHAWLWIPCACLFATPAAAQTVNVSGLADIDLQNLRPGTERRQAQALCVYSDNPGSSYAVTLVGSGGAGAFELSDGAGGALPFILEWSESPSSMSGTELRPGAMLGPLRSTATTLDCGGNAAPTAALIIVMKAQDTLRAVAGIPYSGNLSLTIVPQ